MEAPQKIRNMVDSCYEILCHDCFDHWTTSLHILYPGFTFEENKEALFYLLHRLLSEGRVKFRHPFDWLGEEGLEWTASIDQQIEYFRLGWPKDVNNENDVKLTYYFYEYVPAIVWKGDDGQW